MAETIVLAINTLGSTAPVTAFSRIHTAARTLISSMIQTAGVIANQPLRVWSQQSNTINPPGSPGDFSIAAFDFAASGTKELGTPLDRCGVTIPAEHQHLAASFMPAGPTSSANIDITIQLE